MTQTTKASTEYFRTAKGSHYHTDAYCANFRRSIMLGDIICIDEAEALTHAPCTVCTDATKVEAHAAEVAAKADALCENAGIAHPGQGRIYDDCKTCGKNGKVNRATGRIRAHKPA